MIVWKLRLLVGRGTANASSSRISSSGEALPTKSIWDELDELLRTRWRHPFGGLLKIDAAIVDCGDGDHFDAVMNFCVPKMGRRIFAGKGMYGAQPAFQMARGKTVENRMVLIGVDGLKNVIFDKLFSRIASARSNSRSRADEVAPVPKQVGEPLSRSRDARAQRLLADRQSAREERPGRGVSGERAMPMPQQERPLS